jgi:hypothetical protein
LIALKHPIVLLTDAESGEADVFLTADDAVIRRAKRLQSQLHVRVENPHTWLQEHIGTGDNYHDR